MTNKEKINSFEQNGRTEPPETQNEKARFGKFENPDELLLAYNALESEFTKRCQLVKQLQAELASLSAQESNTRPKDGTNDSDPVSTETPPEAETAIVVSPSPDTQVSDVLGEIMRNIADYAEVLSAVPEITDACIAQYKKRLMDADRIRSVASPSGMAVIMPAARPRTLSDAKRLADKLLTTNY